MITRLRSHLDLLKRICLLFIVLICEISVTSCNSREVTSVVDRTEMVNITFQGGSGKAHVESPVKVVTHNGTAYATLVWSSKNYDYIIVDGNKYYNENEGGPSTFTIPVASLDEPLEFIGDTLAMSQPHEIEYTIIWNKSPEETDTETVDNSGRGFGIRPDESAITMINGIKETGRLELTHATGFDIRQTSRSKNSVHMTVLKSKQGRYELIIVFLSDDGLYIELQIYVN